MTISILVPYRTSSKRDPRIPAWEWIRQRWSTILPDAEIVMGEDNGGFPFSKTTAVNDAYRKSSGDMLVIADADTWVERRALMNGIETAERRERLVMPWIRSYRFNKVNSKTIMAADPLGENPITDEMRKQGKEDAPSPATAAMVAIIQRQAFARVGGMDPRFRGWGSEDVSFGLACWTLLGRNAFTIGEAYALYHHRPIKKIKSGYDTDIMHVWPRDPGGLNYDLYQRYWNSRNRPDLMVQLCAEHALDFPVSVSPDFDPDNDVSIVPLDDHDPDATPIARERQGGMIEGERITI